jgi:hypothetical protein
MFEVSSAVRIQVQIFWVVTHCSFVVGYQCFGRPCCLHFSGWRTWLHIGSRNFPSFMEHESALPLCRSLQLDPIRNQLNPVHSFTNTLFLQDTCRDSSVVYRCATSWMIGGSRPGRGWEFFSSPSRPDRLWSPPSLLSSGYQVIFPWG